MMAAGGGGGDGWRRSGVPGFERLGDCAEGRVSSLDALVAGAQATPSVILEWNNLVLEGNSTLAYEKFTERLGCPADGNIIFHQIGGGSVRGSEIFDVLQGAALSPDFSLIQYVSGAR